MKQISILGSTGSIGRQALEVAAAHPERFRVSGLTTARNINLLAEQAHAFRPSLVAVADTSLYPQLRRELSGMGIRILAGREAIIEAAADEAAQQVLVALVGSAGLEPTLAALEAGKEIALANKETLVAAGSLIMSKAREHGTSIMPVDSEHSALHQCMDGTRREDLRRVYLTASGGPFRDWSPADLDKVTPSEALAHPTWRMGDKVTIDSATLMNKGMEVIEAHWLFDIPFKDIKVVIHRESIVHSMVEFTDGAVLAQLGLADMRVPIAYALGYPERLSLTWPKLDILSGTALHFEAPDTGKFPALELAYDMGGRGGTAPAVMSAANEVAVAAFLQEELRFTDIVRIVSQVCGHHGDGNRELPELEDILEADGWARTKAKELLPLYKR